MPYAKPAERTGHVKVKAAAYLALLRAVRKAGLPCHVLGDGSAVRIPPDIMYGPDTLACCGPELPDDALEVPDPVVLVEAASPSTRRFDATAKRDGYFSPPSLHHYLIIDPDGPPVVHYSRRPDPTRAR